MKIIICKDYEEMSLRASEIVIEQIKNKPNSVLGFATGSTPMGMYNNLIKANKKKEISFKDIITYNLDEYIGLDYTHPQSYHKFMYENLFDHIDINKNNIHIPSGDLKKLDEIADLFNADLNKNRIDLQILGLGTNGHIGFNEPGTPVGRETFIQELSEQTRKDNMRFFNSFDEVPKYAITMGIKNIMKSRKIMLMADGLRKADIMYKTLKEKVNEQVPSSILQIHPDVIVILDELAASRLLEHMNKKERL